MTRLLELLPVRFVGQISYSLYLWQQLFFLDGHSPAAWPLARLQQFPWNYTAAFSCAIASFYLIERPLIRVGRRIALAGTSGRQDVEGQSRLLVKRAPSAGARVLQVDKV
jgi:peptidoglycan/LPS O-acetylase OafA/YrhL